MKDLFRHKVAGFIEENRLFDANRSVIVALSGGADSVALLRVLLQCGYQCVAAHCNFHLRGDESVRDEEFVCALCREQQVPLEVVHFDTVDYARQNKVSIEMAARELRYRWFDEIRAKHDAQSIAVAHHRDDSVETLLLNLVRGTGINGLTGISVVNGNVVRPLLCVSREDILQYLERLHQPYVTDSTNLVDDYTRNKIRLNILPALAEINPSVSESIAETARRLMDVHAVYSRAMSDSCRRVTLADGSISVPLLLDEVAPQAVLFELLRQYGVNASQLHDILRSMEKGESGRRFYTSAYELLLDRDVLLIRSSEREEQPLVLVQEVITVDDDFCVPRDKGIACLDADSLPQGEVTMRVWRSGDRFVPFGMKGFKKVRDYLRDRKQSLFEKESQRVVCVGDEIVWLVGERTDNRFRVTPTTRRVLKLAVQIPNNGD